MFSLCVNPNRYERIPRRVYVKLSIGPPSEKGGPLYPTNKSLRAGLGPFNTLSPMTNT